MGISPEEFEHLDDVSGLENLHVYGSLLKLYTLPVQATIIEVGNLCREIQNLDSKLLTLYVSYVLGHTGFDIEDWADEDYWEGTDMEPLHTTKFKDKDWIENMDMLEPSEESEWIPEWEVYYRNTKQKRLKVIFVALLMTEINARTGESLDEAEHILKRFDKSCLNYVVVHPKLARQAKKTFRQTKQKMKQKTGKDLVISTGEFVAKTIPNHDKRAIIEENWDSLRERIIKDLRKKWPILIFAADAQQIAEATELIKKSRAKYETHNYEDAIKDAGVACESLLQILYSVHVAEKTPEELEFHDLLCALNKVLDEDFGSNIYQDLDFVRMWRNNVVHPRREKPDDLVTLQVVAKVELFNELFKKRIFERNLRSTGSS
jgi:hypothetical protein